MKHQILLSFKNMVLGVESSDDAWASVDFNKNFRRLKLDKSGKDKLDSFKIVFFEDEDEVVRSLKELPIGKEPVKIYIEGHGLADSDSISGWENKDGIRPRLTLTKLAELLKKGIGERTRDFIKNLKKLNDKLKLLRITMISCQFGAMKARSFERSSAYKLYKLLFQSHVYCLLHVRTETIFFPSEGSDYKFETAGTFSRNVSGYDRIISEIDKSYKGLYSRGFSKSPYSKVEWKIVPNDKGGYSPKCFFRTYDDDDDNEKKLPYDAHDTLPSQCKLWLMDVATQKIANSINEKNPRHVKLAHIFARCDTYYQMLDPFFSTLFLYLVFRAFLDKPVLNTGDYESIINNIHSGKAIEQVKHLFSIKQYQKYFEKLNMGFFVMALTDAKDISADFEENNPFLKRSDYLHVFGMRPATFYKIESYAKSCPINKILASKFRL